MLAPEDPTKARGEELFAMRIVWVVRDLQNVAIHHLGERHAHSPHMLDRPFEPYLRAYTVAPSWCGLGCRSRTLMVEYINPLFYSPLYIMMISILHSWFQATALEFLRW